MKKIYSLLSVALLASSVFAIPATDRKMKLEIQSLPRERAQVKQVSINDPFEKPVMGLRKNDVKSALKPVAKAPKASKPTAYYHKPEGAYFLGIGEWAGDQGTSLFWMQPTLVGSNLNGNLTWLWENHSSNAFKIDYETILDLDYPEYKGEGWSMDEKSNFIDTTIATSFGKFGYYYSLRMPLQTATNVVGKDQFYLIYDTATTRPDTAHAWTIAGAYNQYSSDGMWPMTNAMFATPKYGEGLSLVWDVDDENNVSFIYGTEKMELIDKIDTTFAEDGTTIEKIDTTYRFMQPAAVLTAYDKPMSPLYIRNITAALVSVGGESGLSYLDKVTLESLRLTILDKDFKEIVSSTATIEDTTTMVSFWGQLVTFKLEEEDEFGVVTEGVVLRDSFYVKISGLNNENNHFGIWSAFSPYTGGSSVIIDSEDYMEYVGPYDPFIMLNGIYYTFEHFARTDASVFGITEQQYIDTINIKVVEETEDGETYYIAYHADGDWEDDIPYIRAMDLLYDTISHQYNYDIDAPDWVTDIDMGMYNRTIWSGEKYTWWSYFNMFTLGIFGDPADDEELGAPEVGDEIKLSKYGIELVLKVVSTPDDPQGVENVNFRNNGKSYNILGMEVGDDYKGIIIRNGEKFIR